MVYTLQKNSQYDFNDILEYKIVSPRESILQTFLDLEDLNSDYTIRKVKCSVYDYNEYFSKSNKYNICVSVDIQSVL